MFGKGSAGRGEKLKRIPCPVGRFLMPEASLFLQRTPLFLSSTRLPPVCASISFAGNICRPSFLHGTLSPSLRFLPLPRFPRHPFLRCFLFSSISPLFTPFLPFDTASVPLEREPIAESSRNEFNVLSFDPFGRPSNRSLCKLYKWSPSIIQGNQHSFLNILYHFAIFKLLLEDPP